jgi:hypothetical protein
MTTILHIDSSILGSNSVSRSLTAEIVAKEVKLNPGATLLRRDLVADELQHLSPAHLAVFQGNTPTSESLANDIALGSTYIDELFSADIIIIGVPMYNFSLPSQLKAWLDRVLVAGGHSTTPRMVRKVCFQQVKCISLQLAVAFTAVPALSPILTIRKRCLPLRLISSDSLTSPFFVRKVLLWEMTPEQRHLPGRRTRLKQRLSDP